MQDCVNLVGRGVSFCLSVLDSFFDKLGAWGLYMSIFAALAVFRLYLVPLLGTALGGSDKVKKTKGKKQSSKKDD